MKIAALLLFVDVVDAGMYSGEVLEKAAEMIGISLTAINLRAGLADELKEVMAGWNLQSAGPSIHCSMIVYKQSHYRAIVRYQSGCLAVLDSLKPMPDIISAATLPHYLMGNEVLYLLHGQVRTFFCNVRYLLWFKSAGQGMMCVLQYCLYAC